MMDEKFQVSLIIPNWNGIQYLEPCLDSVFAQSFKDFQVVLVDNGSTDGSLALVEQKFPQVCVIANRQNLGFALANNQAIQASYSEFVATLNNDTEVETDWLSSMVQALMIHPEAGVCASKMILKSPHKVIDSAGIDVDRAGMIWNRLGGIPDLSEMMAPLPVFGACAGAALYRRSMLDEIGLFDEEFFAYLEDVDLSWRAQWAGWKALYVPQARVLHVHSATGGGNTYFKSWLLGRNKVWLLIKNYPWPFHLSLLVLFYDLLSMFYALWCGRGSGAILGRLAAFRQVPLMIEKRHRMVRRVDSSSMMRLLAPAQSPWSVWSRYKYLQWPKGGNSQQNKRF